MLEDSSLRSPGPTGPPEPDRVVVGFARALRHAGLAVPVGSVLTFASALVHLGVAEADRVYWAGRATLVHRPEDIACYDTVFAAFWADRPITTAPPPAPVPVAIDDPDDASEAPKDGSGPRSPVLRWSAVEVLRHRDFALLTDAEWADVQLAIRQLRTRAELRPARRRQPVRRRRGHPDLRRTIRGALRTGGEPLDRSWRSPRPRPRRVVLLIDISGSMEPYARALLCFAHATVGARRAAGADVFALGTRITRISRELGGRDPDAALRAAAAVVPDWSGGTRLGEGLADFNDRWGGRGAVVVVLSDGWDRGDPALLADQMARLARVAHRVVWANPLKASPGYAPLARGMAAALPHIDAFVEGHSLEALQRLAAVIGTAGSIGMCQSPERREGERRADA